MASMTAISSSALVCVIFPLLTQRGYPNCLVHVFGCFNPQYPGTVTGIDDIDAALQAATTGLPRTWFHSITNVGYTKADATHPDTAGHTTLYKAIYNKIAAVHGLRTVA
jgi:hypothetical protein